MRFFTPAIYCLLLPILSLAEEGIWLFNQAPKAAIKSKYRFDLKDSFLDKMRLASVRFDNGGSGSFVSPNGLLLTNPFVDA